MKIVIDANLIIASYWNRKSNSYKILNNVLKDKCDLYYTEKIRDEIFYILDNIKAKKPFINKVKILFKKANKVTPDKKINLIRDDPDDNKYLECAHKVNAQFIISNDRHLLEVRKYNQTNIVKPSIFLKKLEKNKKGGG